MKGSGKERSENMEDVTRLLGIVIGEVEHQKRIFWLCVEHHHFFWSLSVVGVPTGTDDTMKKGITV